MSDTRFRVPIYVSVWGKTTQEADKQLQEIVTNLDDQFDCNPAAGEIEKDDFGSLNQEP